MDMVSANRQIAHGPKFPHNMGPPQLSPAPRQYGFFAQDRMFRINNRTSPQNRSYVMNNVVSQQNEDVWRSPCYLKAEKLLTRIVLEFLSKSPKSAGIGTLTPKGGRDMAYSDKVVDHFNHPRNMGSFGKDEQGLGTGIVGAPECGDVMKLQIKVQENTIVDAKFKTFGCGSAIASSSLATEWLKGKTVDEAATIKNTDIVNELNLPPVKIHCSVLAEDAIKAALADYKKQ
jgi:nitrogen fixation protein NifU and related proteins